MTLQIKFATLLFTVGIWQHAVSAEPQSEQFSPLEQQVWQIVQNTPADMKLTAINALEQLQTQTNSANQRALLLMHQCRLAVRHYQQPQHHLIQQLEALISETQQGRSALAKCQQYHAILAEGSTQILHLENTAYYGLNAADGPLMIMWLAYDFANAAMDAGFVDEAMIAINRSIQIAKQNQFSEWHSESLGILALLQSDLAQYAQGLKTVESALALTTDANNRDILTLRQAFILKQAKDYDSALAVYQQLLNQQLLNQADEQNDQVIVTASLNIAAIYQATNRHAENLLFTAQLLQRINKQSDPYAWYQAAALRAMALLANQQYQAAAPLFAEALAWFEQNEWLVFIVPTLDQWSTLLASQGQFEAAFQAAQQSKKLREQLNEQRRMRDATLQNAQLEVAKQQQALLESQQAHQQVATELERKQQAQRQIQIIMASVLLFAVFILLAYLRLRQANQTLALKNIALDYESTHDPLTKVYNRRYFNQFIQEKLGKPTEALLVLIDVDHFKKVNDTYGHQAGDQVLIIVSQRLASRLRVDDRIIRWGGEEFLIFIENPADVESAKSLVERLLTEIHSTPIQLEQHQLLVTISAGFCQTSLADTSALDEILIQIDDYLYQAKHQGRNQAIGYLTAAKQQPYQLKPLSLTE